MYLMGTLYILAGLNHFRVPKTYATIMPPYLPAHYPLIYLTGILEAGLGLLLMFDVTRNFAAWGLMILLVLIFPANIQMTINYWKQGNPNLWITILRLPLQVLLVWWAYQYTSTTGAIK